VEDVRPILVDQHARFVEMIVGVAGDVRALVDDEHARVVLAGEPLGEHRAGKAGADDEIVVLLLAGAGDEARPRLGAFDRLADEPGHAGIGRVPADVGELGIDGAQPLVRPCASASAFRSPMKASAPSAMNTASRSP
jgi:hypothetical protein